MTALLPSPIGSCPSAFSSVLIMEDKDLPLVIRTLRLWKHYLNHYLSSHKADRPTKELASDFIVVLRLFQKDIGRLIKKEPLLVFVAKDTTDTIQGLACCRMPSPTSPKVLDINELLCAPWNLRWRIKPYPHPLHGGGVLLISAIFKKAQKEHYKHLLLHSAPTSICFYKKLGMNQSGVNVFSYTLEDVKDQEKISLAFARAFGPSRVIDSFI